MHVRGWLIGVAIGCATALGCGGGNKGSGISASKVAGTTAQALTDGLSFSGGIVKTGGIPDASNESVTLDPGSSTLALEPSGSLLMPLDINNPEEDTDPVAATLLQFGDDNNHVEIPRKNSEAKNPDGSPLAASAAGLVHLEVQIAVGSSICRDLCQGKLELKMLMAALLASGAVGKHATRDVELDCGLSGNPDKCASGPDVKPDCETDKQRCTGNGSQTCTKEGKWGTTLPCRSQTCIAGVCRGVCAPDDSKCNGLIPQNCSNAGDWEDGKPCKDRCSNGVCLDATDAGVKPDASMVAPPPPDAGVDAGSHVANDAAVETKDAGPTCIGGGACEFTANACHEGVYACDADHQPVCQDNGPKTNGTGCGADHVCFGGVCVACKVGDVCDSTNSCSIGTFDSCAAGPHCAQLQAAPDGTACGTADHVCSGGSCVACQQDAPCNPSNECHNGKTDCTSGPVCTDLQTNAPDGNACSANGGRYCQAGVCVPCHAGDPCTLPGNACRIGTIACGATAPSCTGSGALAPDGSDCGSGRVCMTGSCVSTSWVLAVESGNNQSKRVDEQLAPVTISVKDQGATGVAGVVVQIATPAGAYAPATAVTNTSGIATIVPRLGRALGPYTFTVSSSAAPSVTITATAIAPAPKTLFSVVNQSHSSAQDGLGGPATMAHVSYAYAVTAAADGTLYFADSCSVFMITPAGVITRVAGTGNCGSSGGDIGAATSIQLYYPTDLALDETNGFLYISDSANQKVRQLDLATGTMETYAGGGTTTSTDYGDNQTATLAVLSSVTSLSLDPAGNLYITDSGHSRIRKVDTAQVITTHLSGTSTCPVGLAVYSCNSYCSMAWDANGQAFIAAQLCGSATNNAAVYGIARVEQNGSLSLVAGSSNSSSTGDGIQATAAYFSSLLHITFDNAGNLYLAGDNEARIRRIDAATGIITTVAGDGTQGYRGDYVDGLSPTSAEFYYIKDIAFDRQGNLYITDYQNYMLRAIWGQGDQQPKTVSMAISAGNNQSANVDALFSPALAVTLTDNQSQPIAGANVTWQALDAGSGVNAGVSLTTVGGVASMSGRPGLPPGAYHFTARYRDLHGRDATGSPASFVVNATTPSAGTVFTIVDADHTSGTTSQPTPGPYAHTSYAMSVAAGSDGTLYIGEYCQVSTLSPAGVLTPLVGNGSCTSGGDGGRAIDARVYDVEGLVIDESNPNNRLLYVNDRQNAKIRVVYLDANPPTIDTFVGYTGGGAGPGSPNYGVPGPGTGVVLGGVYGMSVNPADHNLYLVDSGHQRILQVDPAGNVSSWLTGNQSCTGVINLYNFQTYSQIVWAPGGVSYITANLCGTSTNSNAVLGVLQRAPNGTLTWIAGQNSSSGNTTNGSLATSTYFASFGMIAIDPAGTTLYLSQYGSNIVRQISALDGSGTVSTIAGTGTAAYLGDYVPATTAQLYQPWGLALTPAGHLVIADYYNYAFREIW
jgi:sugar lactone lactonase YvrE